MIASGFMSQPITRREPVVNDTVFVFAKNVILFCLVCLRVQTNPRNRAEFKGISPERAFADFIFANVILHLVVMNFIG